MNLKPLAKNDVVGCQKRGYLDEHLASLYSTTYGKPYLFRDKYLLYHDDLSKLVWLTLFRLDEDRKESEDVAEVFKALLKIFQPDEVVTTSPTVLPLSIGDFRCNTIYKDKDYQINLGLFDEKLAGGDYKHLRYRVRNGEKRGYTFIMSREVTTAHSRIVALHMTKSAYAAWDYQLYLRLCDYFARFSAPMLFNVFLDDALIGFDVVDFLSDTMTIPLGFYLDYPSLADFLLYREILHGKKQDFEWLDVGWACNNSGLEVFKKKWKAVPRFNICMQDFRRIKKNE